MSVYDIGLRNVLFWSNEKNESGYVTSLPSLFLIMWEKYKSIKPCWRDTARGKRVDF